MLHTSCYLQNINGNKFKMVVLYGNKSHGNKCILLTIEKQSGSIYDQTVIFAISCVLLYFT